MKNQLFIYPRLGNVDTGLFRIGGGAGLGNLLIQWARAVALSKQHSIPLIAPTWPQLKIGPFLRGEKDTRTYFGLFRTLDDEISGFKKMWLLNTMPKIGEEALNGKKDLDSLRGIVEVGGLGDYFDSFLPSQSFVKSRLFEMLQPKLRPTSPKPETFLGVHIRLGDFATVGIEELESGRGNRRLPLIWYQRVIENIRKGMGMEIPVRIFSDGTTEQLGELLSLPKTVLQKQGTSIGDLLIMADSSVFIASASTFSMWASFLGQMPTVWFKGQIKNLLNEKKDREIEVGLEGEVPLAFSGNAARELSRK